MSTVLQALKNPWISLSFAVLGSFVYPLKEINDQIGFFASIEGKSMQPTLNPEENGKPRHEWVLVNKIHHKNYQYHHGDIVMLRSPTDPKRFLIKRIIGLPGDWIQLKDNKLIEVSKGSCWVEGDNWKNSIDSYSFGQVPLALLEGTVKYVVFPFRSMRSLPVEESSISRVIIKEKDLHEFIVCL